MNTAPSKHFGQLFSVKYDWSPQNHIPSHLSGHEGEDKKGNEGLVIQTKEWEPPDGESSLFIWEGFGYVGNMSIVTQTNLFLYSDC